LSSEIGKGAVMSGLDSINRTNAPAPVALIRFAVGLVFLTEGPLKFLYPDKLGTGRFLKIGIPVAQFMGPFVGGIEIVCGGFLILGLLTRLAAIPLIIDISTAISGLLMPIRDQSNTVRKGIHQMKPAMILGAVLALTGLCGCSTSKPEMMGNLSEDVHSDSFYLPNAEASRIVTVTTNCPATATVLVQTHRVAVKETGPKETVEKFGEVYSFSPNFFAVHLDEPTRIRFLNLQPDDNHSFMLVGPGSKVLMNSQLPPLTETAYVFTFRQEGLYNFVCSFHPNVMFGQILVLPPVASP